MKEPYDTRSYRIYYSSKILECDILVKTLTEVYFGFTHLSLLSVHMETSHMIISGETFLFVYLSVKTGPKVSIMYLFRPNFSSGTYYSAPVSIFTTLAYQ